jgi:hypothetical protein
VGSADRCQTNNWCNTDDHCQSINYCGTDHCRAADACNPGAVTCYYLDER